MQARLTAAAVIVVVTAYITIGGEGYKRGRGRVDRTDRERRFLFLETAYPPEVTGRFACAIESAAKHHPGWAVNVLAAVDAANGTDSWLDGPFKHMLAGLPNVAFGSVQVADILRGTPLESWSAQRKDNARFKEVLSNVLRLALLYKRGGVYLSKDTIVMRPLHAFHSCLSQTALRKGDAVSNSFLFFKAGHPFLRDAMEHVASEHHPANLKASIGSSLLHDVLLERCGVDSVASLAAEGRPCRDVLVLPWHTLMPVPWTAWNVLFDVADTNSSWWEVCRDSHAMCLYGKMSGRRRAERNSPYWRAATEHCPRSLNMSLDLDERF
ncbi:lactosylceramide 4-alpha-galactosyltransferase isoform X3 [Rhipicephalus microplus]|uniref:lactosylceramide 4-alpha-galactosyltransferase isoform X3 n=1 Tax=Rhipicephalus microplus TaxID=6941 RepID=UPI003F6AA3AD